MVLSDSSSLRLRPLFFLALGFFDINLVLAIQQSIYALACFKTQVSGEGSLLLLGPSMTQNGITEKYYSLSLSVLGILWMSVRSWVMITL